MQADETLVKHVDLLELDLRPEEELLEEALSKAIEAHIASMWSYIYLASYSQDDEFEPRTAAEYIRQTKLSIPVPFVERYNSRSTKVSEAKVQEMLKRQHFDIERVTPTVSYRKLRFREKYVCEISFVVNDVPVEAEE